MTNPGEPVATATVPSARGKTVALPLIGASSGPSTSVDPVTSPVAETSRICPPFGSAWGGTGQTFDWAFTSSGIHAFDMALVIVKGGPASAVYTYDFASIELDDSDSGLAAPTNPKNGKDYGISHIQFCYDPKGGGDN